MCVRSQNLGQGNGFCQNKFYEMKTKPGLHPFLKKCSQLALKGTLSLTYSSSLLGKHPNEGFGREFSMMS